MEEVVSKLNEIYVGSIFQEYGIKFRILKVHVTITTKIWNQISYSQVELAELECKGRECSQVVSGAVV